MFVSGIGLLAMLVSRSSVSTVPAVATPSVPGASSYGDFLKQFETDADLKLASARASLAHGSVAPSQIDNQLARVKIDLDEVTNLRERFAAALRQARLEYNWPLQVGGWTFDRPAQLQQAIDNADAYLRRGAAVEQQLVSASEQGRRTQASAEQTLAEMQQIRADLHLASIGRLWIDTASLHDKRARFAELNAELAQTIRDAGAIDWKKYDLPRFQINVGQ